MQRYAITDRRLLPPATWPAALREQVAQWVAAGVEWVQLREKDLPAPELEALTRDLARLTRGTPTRLLVGSLAPALARAAGADGVHLAGPPTAARIAEARAAAGLVTVSCHILDEVAEARTADAVLWAPVFGKMVRGVPVHPGTGLDALRAACAQAAPTPVFALGGVTAANARDCLRAGAAGVAGIRLSHSEGWRGLLQAAEQTIPGR